MELWNSTLRSRFILPGILNGSGSPELLGAALTALYVLALIIKGLTFLIITVDICLYLPMYLLVELFSFMDCLFTSVITPTALANFRQRVNTISFGGSALKMFLVRTLGDTTDLLLDVMAYDRYVVICHPLNTMVFMGHRVCRFVVTSSWILVF